MAWSSRISECAWHSWWPTSKQIVCKRNIPSLQRIKTSWSEFTHESCWSLVAVGHGDNGWVIDVYVCAPSQSTWPSMAWPTTQFTHRYTFRCHLHTQCLPGPISSCLTSNLTDMRTQLLSSKTLPKPAPRNLMLRAPLLVPCFVWSSRKYKSFGSKCHWKA